MRLHLTKSELTEHWLNFVFLSIPIVLIGYATINSSYNQNEFPISMLILALMYVSLIRSKWICRKFDKYKTSLTPTEFKQANIAAARLNEWEIISNQNNYFSAYKSTHWQWDGIRITAILQDGKIFLNSMVNPSLRSNPFTFGLNRRNKIELIKQYKSILQGDNVTAIVKQQIIKRNEEFWNESESSSKNMIMKLIGYPLGIAFMMLGCWMLLQKDLEGLIFGSITIGFVVQYFYYDLKVIVEKRKRKREPGYNRLL